MIPAYYKTLALSSQNKSTISKYLKNNIMALRMGILELENNLITGPSINCKKCSVVVTSQCKKNMIKNEKETIWRCEFCQHENHLNIENDEIPKDSNFTCIINNINDMPDSHEEEKDWLEGNKEIGSIIFCIDISKSMNSGIEVSSNLDFKYVQNKNYPTRLELVKIAVDDQIHQLEHNNPNANVGIIFFDDFIRVYGDCCNKSKRKTLIGQETLYNYEKILSLAEDMSKSYMRVPIKNASSEMLKSLEEIKTFGSTALGPAVLFSIGMSKKNLGSKIIICTDGIATRGLGLIEKQDPTILEESKKFYYKIGLLAKEKGIVISVISIVDTECKLGMISPIANLTGGNILRVNPLNLPENFSNCMNDVLIATNVRLEARINKYFEFTNVLVGELSLDNTCLKREVGNVTRKTILTFEYRIKPPDALSKMNISNIEEIKTCPFQIKIFYENMKGWKCMKLLNQTFEISKNEEEEEKKQNSEVIGVHCLQIASSYCSNGDYNKANIFIKESLQTYKNDNIIAQKLQSMNHALQEQNAENLQVHDFAHQKDSLSFEINQANKLK